MREMLLIIYSLVPQKNHIFHNQIIEKEDSFVIRIQTILFCAYYAKKEC